ncbi:unnamed protein product, partial [marine sediment metagenome]
FDLVVHLAAFIEAGESMVDPKKYFENNTINTLKLLSIMLRYNVKNFIFSSTAAIYGEPVEIPLLENHPENPTNNYGLSKLMIEHALRAYDHAYGLKYISLRYFNAAGSDKLGDIGEDHNPETHLIPLTIKAALGEKSDIKIFGIDYPTKDGTCIRDYIHVSDLADAHLLAIDYLMKNKKSDVFNLGGGKGYSVREVVDMVKDVSNREFKVIESKRRLGDPAVLVASSEKIKRILGWNPKYDLRNIIETAWKWHS